jgi:hypothetical protein
MFSLQSPTHAALKMFHTMSAKLMKLIVPHLSHNWRSECIEGKPKRGVSEKLADQLVTIIWQNTHFKLRDFWLECASENLAKQQEDWSEKQTWDEDMYAYLMSIPFNSTNANYNIPSHVLCRLYWSDEERQELREQLQRDHSLHIKFIRSAFPKWSHERDVLALKRIRQSHNLGSPITDHRITSTRPKLCVDEVDELDNISYDPSTPVSASVASLPYDWQLVTNLDQVEEAYKRAYDDVMVEKTLQDLEEESFHHMRDEEAANYENYIAEYQSASMQQLYEQLIQGTSADIDFFTW